MLSGDELESLLYLYKSTYAIQILFLFFFTFNCKSIRVLFCWFLIFHVPKLIVFEEDERIRD